MSSRVVTRSGLVCVALAEIQEEIHERGVVMGGSVTFDHRSHRLDVGEHVVSFGFGLLDGVAPPGESQDVNLIRSSPASGTAENIHPWGAIRVSRAPALDERVAGATRRYGLEAHGVGRTPAGG